MPEPAKDTNTSQRSWFIDIFLLILYLFIGSGFADGLYTYKNESPGYIYTSIKTPIVVVFWPFLMAAQVSKKIGYVLR
jgi:hypothetical protein